MLMGDFNSRTDTLPDFIISDNEKYTPVPEFYVSDETESLCQRQNQDVTSVNEYNKTLTE